MFGQYSHESVNKGEMVVFASLEFCCNLAVFWNNIRLSCAFQSNNAKFAMRFYHKREHNHSCCMKVLMAAICWCLVNISKKKEKRASNGLWHNCFKKNILVSCEREQKEIFQLTVGNCGSDMWHLRLANQHGALLQVLLFLLQRFQLWKGRTKLFHYLWLLLRS